MHWFSELHSPTLLYLVLHILYRPNLAFHVLLRYQFLESKVVNIDWQSNCEKTLKKASDLLFLTLSTVFLVFRDRVCWPQTQRSASQVLGLRRAPPLPGNFSFLYSVNEDLLLGSLLHWFIYGFISVACYFDYCGNIINFEIQNFETSNFLCFSKTVLDTWSILRFHISCTNLSLQAWWLLHLVQ